MAKKKKPAGKPAKKGTNRTNRTPKKAAAPPWLPRLLARLRETGNVKAACDAAGVGRQTYYDRRGSDEAFARDADAALEDATDDLELEARRRAHEGLRRVKFHQGQPIMVPAFGPGGEPLYDDKGDPITLPYVEHEYSDTLMIFLLKAHRPDKYRDNFKVEHAGGVELQVVMTDEERAKALDRLYAAVGRRRGGANPLRPPAAD